MDDTKASVVSLDHLHTLGRRRIVLVAGPRSFDQLLGGEPRNVVVETRAEVVVRASTAPPAA